MKMTLRRWIILSLCLVLMAGLFACADEGVTPVIPAASTAPTYTAASASPGPTPTGDLVNPILDEVGVEAAAWIAGKTNADSVILEAAQIQGANAVMLEKSPTLVEIVSVPTPYGEYALKAMLTEAAFPANARYDAGGNWMGQAQIDEILNNRGLDQVQAENPVGLGIVTQRGNLRRFPTNQGAYKAGGDPYDRLQETELYVGMPVWILHTSTDGLFYYVQSYYYRGWVDASCVAVTKDQTQWLHFASPESFVTVLRPLLQVDGALCDMGVTLPCTKLEKDTYTVMLPVRNDDGSLSGKMVSVSVKDTYLGYLPYTYENFIAQAFLYQGTPYGWGGLNNGVDCSGFVAAVFRTFGFELPRNTGDQQRVLGGAIAVSGQGHQAIHARLKTTLYPTAVYTSGHVMLYLGESDRGSVFIHAPSIGQTVQVTVRSDLSGVLYINEVGLG